MRRGLCGCLLSVALLAGCADGEIRSGTVESTRTADPDPDPTESETETEPSDDWETASVRGTDLLVAIPPDWEEESLEDYEEQARTFLEQYSSRKARKAMKLLLRLLDRGVFRIILVGEFSGYTCWIQVMVEPRDDSLAEAAARLERRLDRRKSEEGSRDAVQLPVGEAVRLERVFAPRTTTGVASREIEYVFMRNGESVSIVVVAPASDDEVGELMADFMDRMAIGPG